MATGSTLPVEVTGFVGRSAEAAGLGRLLRTARLVTVTGPGGVGKTRLALRAAELLPHTIATRLGLPEQDTRPQPDALLEFLRNRQLLLILDTCEHLVGPCAQLAGDPARAIAQAGQGLDRFRPGSAERWMQGWLNFYQGVGQFLLGSREESAGTLRTALTMKHELGDSLGTAYCLEVLGWLAASWERFDRTAWLLGAADAIWERVGTRLSNDEAMEQHRQQAAKAASDALGAGRFAALARAGARDPLVHAVALASGDEDAVVPSPGSRAGSAGDSGASPLTS